MKPVPFPLWAAGEFSIILTRKSGTFDLVGQGIEWGQWGLGCRSPELVHAAVTVVKDGRIQAFEAGFRRPQYRELSSFDWNKDVLLQLKRPLLLRVSPAQRDAARHWCDKQVRDQTYGYPNLWYFTKLGLKGRFGGRQENRELFTRNNPVADPVQEICSQLVDTLLLEKLGIDALPHIGVGHAVPGDMSTVLSHYLAWGSLGGSSNKILATPPDPFGRASTVCPSVPV